MIKNIRILILLIIFTSFNQISANEIKILYKINDNIITSFDVDKEIDYLISLNKNFSNLDKNKIRLIAENSLIREKIKKIEIDKVYAIDYESEKETLMIKNFLRSFWKNLGFGSETEFISFLDDKKIDIREIKKKFVIEKYWNQLIYDKFNRSIKIDNKKIEKIVDSLQKSNSEIISYNLSEIVFSEKSKIKIEEKHNEILESINEIGFKQTALLHSISKSAKFGGEIGWVNQNQISKKIFNNVKNLKIGEVTKPINTAGGSILLLINDKKIITQKINKEKEINNIIASEKNRQLNQFSIMYYKDLESKSYVKKL